MIKDDMEFAGAVSQNSSYSTYYSDNFSVNGTPKEFELEKYLKNPQDNIDNICALSKYFYYKSGVIMRTVNIIRDFGITSVKKDYGRSNQKAKKIIDAYDKRINMTRLLKDILFEIALTGNVALYDRDGQYIDILPLSVIDVSEIIIDGKQLLKFDHSKFGSQYSELSEKEQQMLKKAYPPEVQKARQNSGFTDLNIENTYYIKNNSSRYEKYGVTFLLPAFTDLSQKNLMKEAEKSTTSGIVDQILHIAVGDKDHKPKAKEIEYFDGIFAGKKGSIRATTPDYVKLQWIAPNTDIFGEEKFLEIDKDILSSLGVSITLLRGDGGGNYSDGMINMAGLVKTIESMREDIPIIIEDLYRKELERHGMSADKTPTVELAPIEINTETRQQLLQWLFQSAGLPYEVLYSELDFDYESVKNTREQENRQQVQDVFKLREQPFQGSQTVDNKGGRPEKDLKDRKSDKNQSNNDQPRTGQERIDE